MNRPIALLSQPVTSVYVMALLLLGGVMWLEPQRRLLVAIVGVTCYFDWRPQRTVVGC